MPSNKKTQIFSTRRLQFLGDQDGPPERILKSKIAALLETSGAADVAYLARIAIDKNADITVGLCLGRPRLPEPDLVEAIGNVFSQIFGRQEHLDIIFLNELQESQIAKSCKPFYARVQ